MGKKPQKGGGAKVGSREKAGGRPVEVDVNSVEHRMLVGLVNSIEEVTRFVDSSPDNPETSKALEGKMDVIGDGLLALADLTGQGKRVNVALLIAKHNKLAALVRSRLKKAIPTDIDTAFFNFTEPEKPSEALQGIEEWSGRIAKDTERIRRQAVESRGRADVIAAGPFGVQESFVKSIKNAATEVEAKASELEAFRDRAAALLAEAQTADEPRRAEILAEIQAMSFVDLARDVGLAVDYIQSGALVQERQRIGAEIQDILASLSDAKRIQGDKIAGKIRQAVKGQKDDKLMGLLVEMQELEQAPEPESETSERITNLLGRIEEVVPTTWADILDFDGDDVVTFITVFERLRGEYEQLRAVASGEDKFVALQQVFDVAMGVYDFFSKKKAEKAAAADPEAAADPDTSSPGPEAAGDKKRERVEMSGENIAKLRSFIEAVQRYDRLSQDPRNQPGASKKYTKEELDAFDKELDGIRDQYTENDALEIAQILVAARTAVRKKRMSMPDGLSKAAREAFLSFFGGGMLSPEKFVQEYRKASEREAAESGGAENASASDASETSREAEERAEGEEASEGRADESSDEPVPEDDEPSEEGVTDEDMDADLGEEEPEPEAGERPETGAEEQRERRKRVDALLAGLSAQDLWRDDVLDLVEDEESLFGFSRDELRRNYIRSKLFLDGETEGVFFDQLVAQSSNPDEARKVLRAILAEIKGLTVEQRREIFAAEAVTVEAEWEEEGGPEAPDPDKKRAPDPDAPPPPPGPEAPRGSPAPGPAPESEPGPIPPPGAGSERGRPSPEKETVWTRMRNWARPITDSDIYRVHMKGEKTRAEMDGSAPTLSRPAMVTGAVLSGALSYFGVALPVDGIRYLGQRWYVGNERNEISLAFRAALEERRKRESGAPESLGVTERSDALRRRVSDSRYLTDAQKQELLIKLKGEEDSFVSATSPYDEHLNREVGRILEHSIRTRISEEKVLKEAMNTLFMVSGAQFLRAPTYGAISLYERWNRLTREVPESKAGDRLRSAVSGGFDEWWSEAKGNKGRLAQAAAFGTAARFAGIGATLVESAVGSGFIGDILGAWESKEPSYPAEASGLSQESLDEINERVRGAADVSSLPDVPDAPETPVIPDGPVELPESDAAPVPDATPDFGESFSDADIDDDFEPVPGGDVQALPEESIPDAESVPDAEVILSPEKIPSESLVGIDAAHNGITQALLSGVEARPDLLRAAEQAALGDDYTAALLMRRMAAKDGLLGYWFSEGAVGNVSVVPTYDTEGIPHIVFLNPETGTAYSVDELKALGWLIKAGK